jgi:hypothetical protein
MVDRELGHLYPAFREKVSRILSALNAWCGAHLPGHRAALAEGFRSLSRQKELYAQGRTAPGPVVTQKDGVHHASNHQTGLAADIAFVVDDGLTWDVPGDAWAYLQHLAHGEQLVSGSDWPHFKDEPHIEWPTSDTATYGAARTWKRDAGLS